MADCAPAVSKSPQPDKQDTRHFGSSTSTEAKHSKGIKSVACFKLETALCVQEFSQE